jgi:hypothetical protein
MTAPELDLTPEMRRAWELARKRRRTAAFRWLVHEVGLPPSEALELLRMAQEAGRAAGRRIRDAEARAALEDYKDRYGEYPDPSEFC